MKRTICLFAALLIVLLTACGSQASEEMASMVINGVTYTVDHTAQEISDGTNVYTYEITGNRLTFSYPDGSSYWIQRKSSGSVNTYVGGWSDDYAPEAGGYADGEILDEVLGNASRPQRNNGNRFLALLLAAAGAFAIASPRTLWFLRTGWRFKEAEPSDLSLGLWRIGGGVLLIIATLLFFGA